MTNLKTRTFAKLVGGLILLVTVAGCYGQPLSRREKGTLLGGALGAGGGALVGAAVGHPGAGAAIGGAGGAIAGYAIGNHMQNEDNGYYYRDNGYNYRHQGYQRDYDE
jgi:osmotically inducible lipoprotein OsmB